MQFIIFFFTASAKISSVSVPLLCISFFPFFLLFLIGKYPITLMYTKKKPIIIYTIHVCKLKMIYTFLFPQLIYTLYKVYVIYNPEESVKKRNKIR